MGTKRDIIHMKYTQQNKTLDHTDIISIIPNPENGLMSIFYQNMCVRVCALVQNVCILVAGGMHHTLHLIQKVLKVD